MKLVDRIEEIYSQCCGPNGSVELRTVFKLLWPSLSNQVSVVDLAGIYAVSIPSTSTLEVLTKEIFPDFFRAFARLRFPSGHDFVEKMVEEVGTVRSTRILVEGGAVAQIADKQLVRVLLKYDLPLRKIFSVFSAQGMRTGGLVSWEEVRQLSLGMELDGFLAFCGAYTLVPQLFSSQQCELLFREVLGKYSLRANSQSLQTVILYPQFQLLLCLLAQQNYENGQKKADGGKGNPFARKVVDSKSKPLADALNELLRAIGVSKFDEGLSLPLISSATKPRADEVVGSPGGAGRREGGAGAGGLVGQVALPRSQHPVDTYQSAGNHAKQAMILRMEHLLDEIQSQLSARLPAEAPVLSLLATPAEEVEGKVRLPTKPVVIGDAVPVPSSCPETVEQLLEAGLAHHNLGAFEEALKCLEAARVQLTEILLQIQTQKDTVTSSNHPELMNETTSNGEAVGTPKIHGTPSHHLRRATEVSPEVANEHFFDAQMYVLLCKGNVYQSCGDDEQALLLYIEGWAKARAKGDRDWEVICVNSAGMLAYFNLRYDVALLCFDAVFTFRDEAYGTDSADTATAMNNEGCALYCLAKRGEARLRFEKAWHVMTAALGHRSPRAVTVWKNLEKARRAHAPLQSKKDLRDTLALREDAGRLILGGTFTIAALPPPEVSKKKKTGGKKKKKK